MAPKRSRAKKPTPRFKETSKKATKKTSKKTHILAKKARSQPEESPRFPWFTHFPAEIQWKIFREVINGDPHFHVLRVGRVDDAGTGTWTLSFSPVNKKMDTSGYRMYDELSSVNAAAAAAVGHEMTRRKRGQFERLPFKMLKARIDGAKDLVVLDFARSTVPAIGYFHEQHQILNWQNRIFDSDAVAEQFQNTEKLGIKLSDKHYSCHDIGSNFRCADREDEEHASHASRNNAWRMCPKELAGLVNSFPKLREFHVIVDPYHGNKKHDRMDIYLKNYFATPNRDPTTTLHGTTTIYIPLLLLNTTNDHNNNHNNNNLATTAFATPPHDPLQADRFPTLQDLHDMRAMLASLHEYFCLDLRLPSPPPPPGQPGQQGGMMQQQQQQQLGEEEQEMGYRMGPVEREGLGFGVLVAVGREKVWELGGELT